MGEGKSAPIQFVGPFCLPTLVGARDPPPSLGPGASCALYIFRRLAHYYQPILMGINSVTTTNNTDLVPDKSFRVRPLPPRHPEPVRPPPRWAAS